MFSGMLIPCDSVTKTHDGRFILIGTYSGVNVIGPQMDHTFVFYVRVLSTFTGQLDCKLKAFDRMLGNEGAPIFAASMQFQVNAAPAQEPGAIQTIETQITLPGVKIMLPLEKQALDEPLMTAIDFVLSTNGHEMARTTVSAFFRKAA